METSTSSIIPQEYTHIYNAIDSNQKESFDHSFKTSDESIHHYERLVKALKKTLNVFSNPSPYWYLLYGRISLVSTMYEELEDFYEKEVDASKKYILAPFLARIKAFQNSYDEAIELGKLTLEHIDVEIEPTLLDVILYFESNFSLGLAYAYTRQFEEVKQVISALEEASSKFAFKKLIGDDHMLDYVFIENIIQGYTSFFSGNPKEMADVLESMREWTVNLKDPWLQGFYYNIYGISRGMFQELAESERALRVAFKKFEEVHDLRGYSTVGANLGVSLITKGKRQEGRKYLEAVINPLVSMKNYWLAVGNMLELAKSYLEEKQMGKAKSILDRAQKVSQENDIGDPNIYSMFAFFYSRIGELSKAVEFVDRLQEIRVSKDEDQYADLFYYMASAITSMHTGNLQKANTDIVRGIEIADNSDHFNYAMELSIVYLEIILKRYLVEQKQEYILKALEVVNDVTPLISLTDSPFFETLFYLLSAYLFLAVDNFNDARENFAFAKEIAEDSKETFQYHELELYESRRDFITRAKPSSDVTNPLFDEFTENWLSDEYLPVFYVLEAKRLLQNLQFEKTNLDQKKDDLAIPKLLFIVGQGGITIYSHRFDDDTSIDEVLVGGFISALTTFSQELFGSGMLTRIEQGPHVLLMEKLSDDQILVFIVDQESYSLRKNFKRFSSELAKMSVIEYMPADQVLSRFDPQFQIIEGIIEVVFGIDSEADGDDVVITHSSASQPSDNVEVENLEAEPEISSGSDSGIDSAIDGDLPYSAEEQIITQDVGEDEVESMRTSELVDDTRDINDEEPPVSDISGLGDVEEPVDTSTQIEKITEIVHKEPKTFKTEDDPEDQEDKESDDDDDEYVPSFMQYDS